MAKLAKKVKIVVNVEADNQAKKELEDKISAMEKQLLNGGDLLKDKEKA